jgi:adenylate cyclase
MKPTLLIANADTFLVDVYRDFFVDLGYEVETAAGGLECLSKLRECLPDVLILDRDIPWGGGDGVLARMRQEAGLPQVPVILVISPAPPAAVADCVVPPVVACLAKPFRLQALAEKVRCAQSALISCAAGAPIPAADDPWDSFAE